MPKDKIAISELPTEIRRIIPNSIKSFSDVHYIEDLPVDIRTKVRRYLQRDKSVSYDLMYDVKPQLSEYGDLSIIDNIYDLVIEYIKNFLMVSPDSYPFDPAFHSSIKYYIQKKDTSLQYKLVSNEIQEIIDSISADLDIPVELVDLNIQKASSEGGYGFIYYAYVTININNVERTVRAEVS